MINFYKSDPLDFFLATECPVTVMTVDGEKIDSLIVTDHSRSFIQFKYEFARPERLVLLKTEIKTMHSPISNSRLFKLVAND